MKYVFKKYEFADEAAADALINALPSGTDEDGNSYPKHLHTIVKLGFLYTEQPTFDEEGNELTPGVQSNMYSVDVLWKVSEITNEEGEIEYPTGWVDAEVYYNESWSGRNGAHAFLGWNF